LTGETKAAGPAGATPRPRLDGRVALVTGGGSGIGRAAAIAFAQAGARAVVVAGRRTAAVEVTADLVRSHGAEGHALSADLSDPQQVQGMVERVMSRFGALDVAFNNAGYQEPRAPLAEQDDAVFTKVFDTNVRATFHCMRAEIVAMLANGKGGAIINNASVSGSRNPNVGLSLYSASKAAVISMTRSAAMEYAPQGLRINAVSPGRVVTDMMLRSGIADMSAVAAGLPLRRMGQPEEVANAVVFLASDEASFVVGHILATDAASWRSKAPGLLPFRQSFMQKIFLQFALAHQRDGTRAGVRRATLRLIPS
jgi:NAD(P)-dependent dehydrogenase (short-subunit alcohol dehydrogenase family)